MKTTILLTVLALALSGSYAGAQMMGGGPGMMQGYGAQQPSEPPPQQNYPYMMGGYGYGMGPGMMGGYGMGPGMMGGYGYGMGPGMMGGYGYGMGPGMMGGYGPCPQGNCYGYGQRPWQPGFSSPEKYQKFLDETKELRKKLHDLQFQYGEMLRDPKTTMDDKFKMEKEIFDLQQKIQEKAAQ